MFEEGLEQQADERFVIGAFDQDEFIVICDFISFIPDDELDLKNAGTIMQMYVRATSGGRLETDPIQTDQW